MQPKPFDKQVNTLCFLPSKLHLITSKIQIPYFFVYRQFESYDLNGNSISDEKAYNINTLA